MKKLLLTSLALLFMVGIFANEITIGTGTSHRYEPISSEFGYHRSAAIYTAAEVGGSGSINTISFKAYNTTNTSIPIKVYLRMTTASTLEPAASWPNLISGLTPLYQGNFSGTTAGQWKTITLSTPFNYTGDNLEVLIESNYGGTGGGTKPEWQYSSTYTKNQYIRKNTSAPTTETGTVNFDRPYIQLNISNYVQFPILTLDFAGWQYLFGDVLINTAATHQFTITNTGGGTLILNSVRITSSLYFSISVPPADLELTAGESTNFTVQYLPTVAGLDHSGGLQIAHNVGNVIIGLQGNCFNLSTTIPYFEGFETGNTDQSTLIQHWTQVSGPQTTSQYWTANSSMTSRNRTPRTGSWNTYLESGGQCYMIRAIQLTAGTDYYIELYARQDTNVSTEAIIQVKLGNQASLAGMTQTIIPVTGLVNGGYQRLYGTFSSNTTGLYYIGIQGVLQGFAHAISLDDITIDELSADPLISCCPTGIDFGMVMHGVETGPQNVTISNSGGGTLNVAVADISVIGANVAEFRIVTNNLPVSLNAGQSVVIPVYVTAATEGPISATLNINSSQILLPEPLAVQLSASGAAEGTVIIGNGSSDLSLPIEPHYNYSYTQSIFLKSEINTYDKSIEKVYYYWNGADNASSSNAWTLYMGHTALTAFASGNSWIPAAQLSQVFQGTVALPATAGWIEIPLDTPFPYNNADNLVIAAHENEDNHDESGAFFFSTPAATDRSIYYYSAAINPDPANPPAGSVMRAYPNVMLYLRVPSNQTITIGAGTSSTYEPISSYYGYHRSAAIYPAGQIGGSGTINALAFKAQNTTTTAIQIKIYLKTTTANTLLPAADWATLIFGLTPVYEGSFSGTTAGQWKTITLTTPFNHTGNNLEVLIESNYGGSGSEPYPQWYYSTATGQNLYIRKDGSAPTTETGTVNANRPNIQLAMSNYTAYPPAFAASPANVDFGSVNINTTTAYANLSISNNGGGTLNIYSAALDGGDAARFLFDLNSNPLPWTLTAGASKTIKLAFNPLAAGSYSAYLSFSCGAQGNHELALTGTGMAITSFPTVYDFDTTSSDAFPPPNWSKHSGVLASPTVLGAAGSGDWSRDDWKNDGSLANKAAKINLYAAYNGWLISPPIIIPGAGYEVTFDVAYMKCGYNTAPATTGTDDQFAVLIGNGSSWTPANIVRKWDNAGSPDVLNNIPPAGMSVCLPLGSAGIKYLAFYGISTVSNADNDLMVDNISFRRNPTTPILALSPNVTSWDFGNNMIRTAATKQFTITNAGIGTLNLSSIVASGIHYSISVAPTDLELSAGESTSFTVQYLPTAAGAAHPGTLTIGDNRALTTIALSGSCFDPTISSFPFVEGFETGNTDQSIALSNWGQAAGPEYTDRYWTANSSLADYNRAPRTGTWNACLGHSGQSCLLRPIQMTAGRTYYIELYARQDAATGAKIQVKFGSEPLIAGLTTSIIAETNVIAGAYQRFFGVFSAPATGLYYIGIQGWANASPMYISLDDISIVEMPASPAVFCSPSSISFLTAFADAPTGYQNLTISNYGGGILSLEAADLSLVGTDASQFAFTTTGFPAALTATQSVAVPVRFAPSSAGHKYAALRISYDGEDYDIGLSGYAFSENALMEGFEGGVIPSNWTVINADGGAREWIAQTANPHTGTYAARVQYESSSLANDDWLITPPLQLSSSAPDNISFWMRSYSATGDDAWQVLISTTDANPTSFTMIDEGIGRFGSYLQKSYNLDGYGDAVIYLAIRYMGSYNWYLYVDDFMGPDLYSPIVSTFPWSESFEGDSFPPRAWSLLDADADSENWYRLWDDETAHTGDYYAASTSWAEPAGWLDPDNWLITPAIAIPALGSYMLEYYVGALEPGHPGEHYGVFVSTTGTALTDFSSVYEDSIEEEGWHYRMLDLSGYAGQTLYFAFRHYYSPSSSYLKIDDIVVREFPATPILSYSPAAWDFGITQTMTPTTPQDFVLTNIGNGNLTINSGDLTLNDPEGNFVLTTHNLPVSLAHQDSYSFSVQFIPQSVGNKTATLTIQDNISLTLHTINLSGVAVAEPIMGILGLSGATVAPNNISLNWSSIYGNPGVPGYLHWDDGIARETQGIPAGVNFNVASKFGTDVMARAAGMKLKSVMIHLGEAPQAVDAIKVWKGSNSVLAPTNLLYTQSVSGLSAGWNNIVLTTPLTVSGTSALYVGYHLASGVDAYVASSDYLPAVPGRGNLIDYMGWSTLTDYNRSGNWLIHPYFEAASAKTSGDPAPMQPVPVLSEYGREPDLCESPLIARPNPEAERALLGFNIYRNGVKINSSIVPDYYYLDEDLAAGTYHYAVQSVHHGAVGPISGSIAITILPLPAPLTLPFTETWNSVNFVTNKWSTGSSNWVIKSNLGHPLPCASFSSNPTVWNYSSVLRSYSFDATAMHNLQFSFDLSLDNESTHSENLMTWQIWNGHTWTTLGSYSSANDDLAWTHYSYDVSAYAANQIFKIRFVASGVNSHAINAWYLDNIAISNSNPVLAPVTGLSLQHLGGSAIVSWTAVPGANSYNVYLSEDPYRGYVFYGTTATNGQSILQSELPEFKAFFKVIANAGPFPGAAKLFSPPVKE